MAKFLSQAFDANRLFNILDLKATKLHLKRVIVTPAVYQILAPLNRSLNYWHWADVADCTHLYRLAVSCVFVKQSDLLDLLALLSRS